MSDPSPDLPPIRERCTEFFFDDGSLFLLAIDEKREREKVYCLHPSLLRKRSGMLNDMLTLPTLSGPDAPKDGAAEDSPILLPWPKFAIRKFDHLLIYLFVGPSDYPKGNQFLFDLLDLAHLLDMPDAIQYVIDALEKQEKEDKFHPALKLRLARAYGITQWVEAAARAMMAWPGAKFTEKDALEVGFDVYFEMVSAKFRIDDARKVMAYNTPPVLAGADCLTTAICKDAWDQAWWAALGPHILHPGWSTAGDRIRHHLGATPVPGTCAGCQKATLGLMEERKAFDLDTNLVEECITKIKAICGDSSPLKKPKSEFASSRE